MATVPFTLAHAAAGPPLWRLTGRRLVFSALVVGSMAPDFEYLVYLRTTRTIGHTLPGLVLMCLPATHRNGLIVRHFDFLTHRVGVGHLHVYNVLQYASGLLGMALLAVWYRRWAAGAAGHHPAPPPSSPVLPARWRWTALVAVAVAVASGGIAGVARALAAGAGPRRVLVQGVLGTMAAAALAAVVLAVLLEAILQRRRL